eukprot:257784-Amphidinium_carterae.1
MACSEKMRGSGEQLEQDFSWECKNGCDNKTLVKTLHRAFIKVVERWFLKLFIQLRRLQFQPDYIIRTYSH